MSTRWFRPLHVAALAALAIPGCGGEKSDEDKVRATVEETIADYENAEYRGAEDWCDTRIVLNGDLLHRQLSRGIRGATEESLIEEAVENTRDQCRSLFKDGFAEDELGITFEDVEISEITVNGTAATARVSSTIDGRPVRESNDLIKDNNGQWRVLISELP